MRLNLFIYNLIILSASLEVCSFSSEADFRQIFVTEYSDAQAYLQTNQHVIKQLSAIYKVDVNLLEAVIFPELIRYSAFRDFFETSGLQVLYVNYGAESADFSIGLFQMKPSFIESLEEAIKKYPCLSDKFGIINRYNQSETADIREERLNRMQSINWQVIYLCCYIDLVKEMYELDISKPDEVLVKFISAAYNSGFQNGRDMISQRMQCKFFPYGSGYRGTQYAYADVSWFYYQHESVTINK